MKLKCEAHNKRVMVFDHPIFKNPVVVHRSNGEHCNTPTVKIHGNAFSPFMVLLFVMGSARNGKGSYECSTLEIVVTKDN